MNSKPSYDLIQGDCLEVLKALPDNSVDLVFCSPPYEAARTYGIGFTLKGQDWVNWAVERYIECVRVCRGLVAWVVEGQTRKYQWSTTPALLMADLHRAGIRLHKPPIYKRVGIPGSGGPDWWRNDYEFIVCSSKGKLPWSNNTATGKPCKYDKGGQLTHRTRTGKRVNETDEPKVKAFKEGQLQVAGSKLHTKRTATGTRSQVYTPPAIANPGNVLTMAVGGGLMGSPHAHLNEAPFPEKLAEAFVLSYCPPGGTVLDCFVGSGTTVSVAIRNNRNAIGIDVRKDQLALTYTRVREQL